MDIENYIAHCSVDKSRVFYLMDKIRLAEKTQGTVYTDFLTPEEAQLLIRMCKEEHMKPEFNNMVAEAERLIGAVYSYEREGEYPCAVLKISCNPKFEKLEHRDYLGSLLALGIKREKIGDINVFDDGAEVFLHTDICEYVVSNLDKVKHSGIKCNRIEIEAAREKKLALKEMKVITTSLRLDCVVAALLNLSRSRAAEEIKSGGVKLNHSVEMETNKKVEIKDLVSIKGHGRYIIDELTGHTKSDRITLQIKKYL